MRSIVIRPGVIVEIRENIYTAVVEKSHRMANEEFYYLHIYSSRPVPFSTLSVFFDKRDIERVSVTSERMKRGNVVITTYRIKIRLKR